MIEVASTNTLRPSTSNTLSIMPALLSNCGSVFCPDARFGNNEGHRTPPPYLSPQYAQGERRFKRERRVWRPLWMRAAEISVPVTFVGELEHDKCRSLLGR